ncbi:MAG: LON peptidase substrate-binding domain-containing protein, partial [Pseudomonadota bacterium]
MDIRRKKKEKAQLLESAEGATAAGAASGKAGSRSTALALRPIPEDALILIPLRNAVLFPHVISPITIGRAASVGAAQEAARNQRKVGFLLQRDPKTNEIGPQDLYRVGTAG